MIRSRAALALALVVAAAMALLLLYRHPPERLRFAPRCVLHDATGLHCPGCGATRATHALLHLRFGEAMRKNPLFVLALPFLAVWGARGFPRWVRRRPPRPVALAPPWVAWSIVVIVIGFGVLRNLPWPPFSLLAPDGVTASWLSGRGPP